MKIAFFGTPRLAQIVLENLIASDYKPSLVVTVSDTKVGRGQKISASETKQTALKNKIEVVENLSSVIHHQFDLAILVAYGKILPKKILDIPKHGFINIHPSLLPKYRGPSPIQSAIIKGESVTGVTIIKLDEEVDHGPILAQKEIAIEQNDTHLSLIEKVGLIGSNLLLEVLPPYLSGKTKPHQQEHLKATFTEKITKAQGKIDFENPPDKKNLGHMIRAYFPWPTVWGALMVNGKSQVVKLLPENMIQPEGKKPMTVKEFLNGYPNTRILMEKILPTEEA